MKKLLTICIVLFVFVLNAQHSYDPLSPPNTYRNVDNPNYWKNKIFAATMGNKMYTMK